MDDAVLCDCISTGNQANDRGGGASESTLNNCIHYYNTASSGPNYYSGSEVNVSWQSVAGVNYFLERSTNLADPPFLPAG